jgi:beta-galactosidase/beta-glucuronidase
VGKRRQNPLFLLLAAIFAAGLRAAGAEPAAVGTREIVDLSSGWRFQIDAHDQGERERWFDPGHDIVAWRDVEVPRAWDTYDESQRGYEGIGWYHLDIPHSAARQGMQQRLKFGRVMYQTRAWLNGEYLGEHVDGYLPFSFDITGKLTRPANQLVLRVDNRPRIDWLPAAKQIEWVQYGGILQPVFIEIRNKTAIANLAIRAFPQGAGASLACTVEVEAHEDSRGLSLRVNASGREQVLTLDSHAGQTSRHEVALAIDHATHWSPEAPAVHELEVTLEQGGRVLDRVREQFGIRSIATRGTHLMLNGRPLSVRGVNRYDEYGRFGPNPPRELVEEELRLMKRTGINLIRTHYPQAPWFLELCDRMGILFLEELPINWWGIGGVEPKESILDQALPMLETMIRRDRNHPCIIIWSMCNESKTDSEIGIKVMKRLIRWKVGCFSRAAARGCRKTKADLGTAAEQGAAVQAQVSRSRKARTGHRRFAGQRPARGCYSW